MYPTSKCQRGVFQFHGRHIDFENEYCGFNIRMNVFDEKWCMLQEIKPGFNEWKKLIKDIYTI